MKPKVAIDVGGVLIKKKEEWGADTNFDLNNVQWIPGSLDAVKELSETYDLYILSFCGRKTEMETRQAIENSSIARVIPRYKWIFTREREHKIDQMKTKKIGKLIDDTAFIIDLVNYSGMEGIHFGSPSFPDWSHVVRYLTK